MRSDDELTPSELGRELGSIGARLDAISSDVVEIKDAILRRDSDVKELLQFKAMVIAGGKFVAAIMVALPVIAIFK